MSEPSIAHAVPEKCITMTIVAFTFNKPLVGNGSILVALKRRTIWARRPDLQEIKCMLPLVTVKNFDDANTPFFANLNSDTSAAV